MTLPLPAVDTRAILAARPPKNSISLDRPYAFYVEDELSAELQVDPVATLLLSNRECPFRCVMCDLWRNTIDDPTPRGAILRQIQFALGELPPASHIKLYNSGNFFDPKAVPRDDLPEIAEAVREFRTVVVENHPALCGESCQQLADLLDGELEVALGLETAHEPTLQWLNKQMTVADFTDAANWLTERGLQVRSFVLLRPPGMSQEEGVQWAVRSVRVAHDAGARVVSIVPVRAGNGIMDQLQQRGLFEPPSLAGAERALAESLQAAAEGQRVFLDLWDLQQFASCADCFEQRRLRLETMNHTQQVGAPVACGACGGSA